MTETDTETVLQRLLNEEQARELKNEIGEIQEEFEGDALDEELSTWELKLFFTTNDIPLMLKELGEMLDDEQ